MDSFIGLGLGLTGSFWEVPWLLPQVIVTMEDPESDRERAGASSLASTNVVDHVLCDPAETPFVQLGTMIRALL